MIAHARAGVQDAALREDERDWLSEVLLERWGGDLIVGRGRVRQLSELQALVAWDGEERVGVATYVAGDERAELVTLSALREGAGVGRRLIEAVAEAARAQGARELVVMTTNDNLRAPPPPAHRLPAPRAARRRRRGGAPAQAFDPAGRERRIPIRDELDLVRPLEPLRPLAQSAKRRLSR